MVDMQGVKILLIDWGDTLMVDDPEQQGKMKDWPEVNAVDGAEKFLATYAARLPLFVTSGAMDSTGAEIAEALQRVSLAHYINGYFCSQIYGLEKSDPEFYLRICDRLQQQPEQVMMLGDSLQRDIRPAQKAGLRICWFNAKNQDENPEVPQICSLLELC